MKDIRFIQREKGVQAQIEWGFYPSSFGSVTLGLLDQRIVFLGFGGLESLDEMKQSWERSEFSEIDVAGYGETIFLKGGEGISLTLRGTPFQLSVWNALLKIPFGALVFYEEIAKEVGGAHKTRATATAIGKNPISYLVPCHRVIYKTGITGKYRWGSDLKTKLLLSEK